MKRLFLAAVLLSLSAGCISFHSPYDKELIVRTKRTTESTLARWKGTHPMPFHFTVVDTGHGMFVQLPLAEFETATATLTEVDALMTQLNRWAGVGETAPVVPVPAPGPAKVPPAVPVPAKGGSNADGK